MNEELLYEIGEAILLETNGVKDVAYDGKNVIIVIMEEGKRFLLTLSEDTE